MILMILIDARKKIVQIVNVTPLCFEIKETFYSLRAVVAKNRAGQKITITDSQVS